MKKKAPADSVRVMSVIAIGGMGKSALTWKWFNDGDYIPTDAAPWLCHSDARQVCDLPSSRIHSHRSMTGEVGDLKE